jgi:hypothetical protein
MTFLANGDDPNLVVFPTHRHLHSLSSFSLDMFLGGARDTFEVAPLEPALDATHILEALRRAAPSGPSVAVASPDGRAAILTLRSGADLGRHPTLSRQSEALQKTDAAVLHAGLLEHVLGISPEAQAEKTNIWYPQNAAAALADLRAGRGQALFLMNPPAVSHVRAVAEAGDVMPQKSTFFYPKVMTGLAVHTLDPARRVGVCAGVSS